MRLLRRVLGISGYHSQNLNDDDKCIPGTPFLRKHTPRLHWRCWWRWLGRSWRFEITTKSSSWFDFGIRLNGSESEATLNAAMKPFGAIYLTCGIRGYYGKTREYAIQAFEEYLWINFGDEDKRSRRISINIEELIKGRGRCTTEEIPMKPMRLVLPEKTYDVTVKVSRHTWRYRRWPWKKSFVRIGFDFPEGIPGGRKGPTYGLSVCRERMESAVGDLYAGIWRDRCGKMDCFVEAAKAG